MEKPSQDASYRLVKKKMIAPMCIHNYIHENHVLDKDFHKCDRKSQLCATIPSRYARHLSSNVSNTSTPSSNDLQMYKFYDDIARAVLFLDDHDHVCLDVWSNDMSRPCLLL